MDGSEALEDEVVDEDVGERGDTEEHEDRDEVAELVTLDENGSGASQC